MSERTRLLLRSFSEIDDEVVRRVRTGDPYTRFKHLDFNDRTFAHVGTSLRFFKLDFEEIKLRVVEYRTCKRTKRLLQEEFAAEWAAWHRRRLRRREERLGNIWGWTVLNDSKSWDWIGVSECSCGSKPRSWVHVSVVGACEPAVIRRPERWV